MINKKIKKYDFFWRIFSFLFVSAFFCTNSALAGTLTEYDGSPDDTNNIGVSQQLAQSFLIPANSIISGFKIKGTQGLGASGQFRARIFEGGSNPTNGTEIISQTYNSSILPTYTDTPTLFQVDFTTPTSELTGGSTVYYLVLDVLSGSGNDEIRWSIDVTSSSYADGSRWYGGWSNASTQDENFAILSPDATTTPPTATTTNPFLNGTTTPATDSENLRYIVGIGSILMVFAIVDLFRRSTAGLTR